MIATKGDSDGRLDAAFTGIETTMRNESKDTSPLNETSKSDSTAQHLAPAIIAFSLIALGIALQLAQYSTNRALRLDEAALALNLMDRSHIELLGPLDYDQNQPLLFLLILKTFLLLAGYSEYALRFIPLLSGMVSIPLLYLLARCVTRRDTGTDQPVSLLSSIRNPRWDAALIALAFYAICKHALFYSSDLRQYSTNLLVVCVLYLYVLRPSVPVMPEKPSKQFMIGALVLGAIAVWVSIAAIFILGGIGATYLLYSLIHRNASMTKWSVLLCTVWVTSFFIQYAILDKNLDARDLKGEIMTFEQAAGTAPFPPTSVSDLKWYRTNLEKMMFFPIGLTYRGLGLFTILAGCIALWNRNRARFLMLTLPIAFALFASSLEKYPFKDRYILFLLPCLVILLGEGIAILFDEKRKMTYWIGSALFAILYVQPFAHGIGRIVEPHLTNEVKPLFQYVRDHWEDGDILYCSWGTSVPMKYYQDRYGFTEDMLITEPQEPALQRRVAEYRAEFIPTIHAQGDPYWLLFEHDTGPPVPTHIGETDDYGTQLEVVQGSGVTLYRYTWTSTAPSAE